MFGLILWTLWILGPSGANCNQLVANQSIRVLFEKVNAMVDKKVVNCTPYIPPDFRSLMEAQEPPIDPITNRSINVPMDYLFKCLDEKLPSQNLSSPFWITPDARMNYTIALNEVISLSFDGILVVQINFRLYWIDPRLRWWRTTGIGGWQFDYHVHRAISEVWVPSFRVANCQSERCKLKPHDRDTLDVYDKGQVKYPMDNIVLRSTCNLQLTWFPLDEQNCSLTFIDPDLEDFKPIQLVRADSMHTYFMAENEEWMVLSFDSHQIPITKHIFKYLANGTWNWNTIFLRKNASIIVNIMLKRHPEYYIYNLIVPVLLVAFTGIATVFIPAATDSKLNMTMTVVLTFIFLQGLVASIIPKTPSPPILANYILWSLLLAVFNVGVCAIEMKIAMLSKNSKPWLVLQLLFVIPTRRMFWFQLLQRCFRRPDAPRGDHHPHEPVITAVADSAQEAMHIGDEIDISSNGAGKKDAEDEAKAVVDLLHSAERHQLDTWEAVAFGLNRLTTAVYLLGNALVFALYMCPLLYRISMHSHAPGYLSNLK